MGLSGISPGSLLLILLIALVLFGTNRIQSLGKELGSALRHFREGLNEQSPPKD